VLFIELQQKLLFSRQGARALLEVPSGKYILSALQSIHHPSVLVVWLKTDLRKPFFQRWGTDARNSAGRWTSC